MALLTLLTQAETLLLASLVMVAESEASSQRVSEFGVATVKELGVQVPMR